MTPASRPSTLHALGEFGLIRDLHKHCHTPGSEVIQGIGDDAAILRTSPKESLLASTDLAIEGVHFDLAFESLQDVGYRTAVANISDIAAMGGTMGTSPTPLTPYGWPGLATSTMIVLIIGSSRLIGIR